MEHNYLSLVLVSRCVTEAKVGEKMTKLPAVQARRFRITIHQQGHSNGLLVRIFPRLVFGCTNADFCN